MAGASQAQGFAGRRFTPHELTLIREVVDSCGGLSRMELAHTICELIGWKRPQGSLKGRECREFLERLQTQGVVTLPEKLAGRPAGSVTRVPRTERGEAGEELVGPVSRFAPVVMQPVVEPDERLWFRELVGRYHYLGHRVPYGAHLRYLVFVSKPERQVVGCLQFSSAAWRLSVRDRWIGWSDQTRSHRLQRIVCNSRFLILPWERATFCLLPHSPGRRGVPSSNTGSYLRKRRAAISRTPIRTASVSSAATGTSHGACGIH